MPTRKIRDLHPREKCGHPEHEPSRFRVFEEGVWEHICPACGTRRMFTVRHTQCRVKANG